jgi:hypothetical protein
MRSAAGTKSADPGVVTRATKSEIAFFVGPSFQDGSGSAAEADDVACGGVTVCGLPVQAWLRFRPEPGASRYGSASAGRPGAATAGAVRFSPICCRHIA